MAIYKRGKTYWYKFMWRGESIRESTKQGNPRVARQIEAAHKTSLAKGEVSIRERKAPPSLGEFSETFLKWVAVHRAEKRQTIQFYQTRIRLLLKFESFKNLPLDQIDEALVAKHIEWRKGCNRTKVIRRQRGKVEYASTNRPITVCGINRELAALRRVLRVAREWKVIPSVPVIHLLPGESFSERVLSHAEEEAYLDDAPPKLREFATIAIDTGMRQEEILRMRQENVHFEPEGKARFGYVHNPYGKSKWAKRNLPMTTMVKAFLEARFEAAGKPDQGYVFPGANGAGQLSYDTINSQHDRTVGRLRRDGRLTVPFRLYDLRHTFLTRLGEAGADAFTIQKMAGHSSILVSQRYVHPTPERVEEAISRLEDYNRKKVQELTVNMQVQ